MLWGVIKAIIIVEWDGGIILLFWEFSTRVLADGFSVEFE